MLKAKANLEKGGYFFLELYKFGLFKKGILYGKF